MRYHEVNQITTNCSKFDLSSKLLRKTVIKNIGLARIFVDEAKAFKGQLSMNQYVPLKPIKRGIKVWECADSTNGYVCNLQVYTGRQDGGVTEHGLGYCVVRELSQPFIGKHHHIFCNKFFHPFNLLVIY